MSALDSCKVGDQVACDCRIGFERATLLGKVVAATKTQLTVDFGGGDSGARFVRRTGRRVGAPGGWGAPRLSVPNAETVARAKEQGRRRSALNTLNRRRFEDLPTDCLVRMAEIAKEYAK